ncbi:MAG TPA: hypothetical protein V6D06_07340, partial [Trichocoleus sp.]
MAASPFSSWRTAWARWAHLRRLQHGLVLTGMALGLAGCQSTPVPPRTLNLHQNWKLQPGGEIAGYEVVGGLGDISLDLQGKA